jgi:predicted nucleic acid-binding protein
VLDTNVLVSLLVFRDRRFEALMQAWTQGEIKVLSNAPVRQELKRVLGYPEFSGRHCAEQALTFTIGTWLKEKPHREACLYVATRMIRFSFCLPQAAASTR